MRNSTRVGQNLVHIRISPTVLFGNISLSLSLKKQFAGFKRELQNKEQKKKYIQQYPKQESYCMIFNQF